MTVGLKLQGCLPRHQWQIELLPWLHPVVDDEICWIWAGAGAAGTRQQHSFVLGLDQETTV